jgi:hypothetical protein
MAESSPTLGQLAGAFEMATAYHQEHLAEVKERALCYKAESDRRYEELDRNVKALLDSLSATMTDIILNIRELQSGTYSNSKRRTHPQRNR